MRKNTTVWVVAIVAVVMTGSGIAWYIWNWTRAPASRFNNGGNVNSNWTCSSNNNLNSSATSTHTGDSALACQSVLLITRSDHPLMQRVAAVFRETLRSLPWEMNVELIRQTGDKPIELSARPDMCILLDMGPLKESRSAGKIALEGNVFASAGQAPWASRCHYTDDRTGSIIQVQWNATVSHSSQNTGSGPAGSEYNLPANGIAKSLAENLVKQLSEMKDKHGLMPPLPPALLGDGKPDEPPSILKSSAKLALAEPGWFVHRESFWMLTNSDEPKEFLAKMRSMFEADGFKAENQATDLRMTQGERVIEVFEVTPGERPIFAQSLPAGSPRNYCIHYVHSMSREEMRTLLDQAMTGKAALDLAMAYWLVLTPEQQERVLPDLEKAADTPQMFLRLSRLYHERKQDDKAKAALTRAAILSLTLGDGSFEPQLKDVAKKLGDEKLAKPVLTEEAIEAAGFQKLERKPSPTGASPAESIPAPLTMQIQDDPVRFYCKDPDKGDWVLLTLRVQRTSKNTPGSPFELSHSEFHTGQNWKSWGTTRDETPGKSWSVSHYSGAHTFIVTGGQQGPFTLTVR